MTPISFYKFIRKFEYIIGILGNIKYYYSKQAYKLSFIFVGKTQTKHFPDQSGSVLCSLFANFFQQKMSSIINILPNINSARLNFNLTSNINHWSCFRLPTHDQRSSEEFFNKKVVVKPLLKNIVKL